jgi:hypothetical protein
MTSARAARRWDEPRSPRAARPRGAPFSARRLLRATLVVVWAWGAINVVSSASRSSPPLPQPPYPRFCGRTFQPSAAAFDPATGRVLVFSDRDTTLYRYELADAGLLLPPDEHHDPVRLPPGVKVGKLEGMTRLPSGDFLATTAFDRVDPSCRRLLRFSYAPDAPAEATPVAVDDAALEAAVRAASGQPWSRIEAVAVDRTGTKVFFGVRNVGPSYEMRRDVALVVRCPLGRDRVGRPEAVISLSTAEALGGHAEGLSDLQLDASGDAFLVLTSHEGRRDSRDGHSGHLFRVPARVLLDEAPPAPVALGAPLEVFRAKPEGLAVEPSGALIVVFDDDRDWKRLFEGYEESEGLFTVIEARPLITD